jgi:hypothetical protein
MAQVTGIVKVYVNGSLQRSKEGAKLILGGKERTAHTGHSVYGYSEKVVPAQLEFTLADMADTDLVELSNLVDATAKFETDTGKSYLIANAFTTKPAELTGGEGDVPMEMQGDPAVEE